MYSLLFGNWYIILEQREYNMNSHLKISWCCGLTWANVVTLCGIKHTSPCAIFGNWTFKDKRREYHLPRVDG